MRYVAEPCKQSNPVRPGSKSASTFMFQKRYRILFCIIMLYTECFVYLAFLIKVIITDYINTENISYHSHTKQCPGKAL